MTERLSIEVSDDLSGHIRRAVEAGDYRSTEEVLIDALRLWECSRSAEIERLRELVKEARASGAEPWEGMEAIIAKARQEFEAEKHVPYRAA